MKCRLPIWCQAVAIVSLSCVLLGSILWVEQSKRALAGRYKLSIEDATTNILYCYMPLAVLVLGVRFFWHFRGRDKSAVDRLFYVVGILFVLPALVMLFMWAHPVQRVREASVAWAAQQTGAS